TEAPEIVILKSTAHDPNADPVKIHAVALDASGVERVVINNQQVSLEDDGRFEVDVPRSDVFNFSVTDIHGYQTTRQFADLYNEYTNALSLRVNKEGLTKLSELVEQALREANMFQLIKSAMGGSGPLIELFYNGDRGWGQDHSAGFLHELAISVNDLTVSVDDSDKTQLNVNLGGIQGRGWVEYQAGDFLLQIPLAILVGRINTTATIENKIEAGKWIVEINEFDLGLNPHLVNVFVPSENQAEAILYALTINPLIEIFKDNIFAIFMGLGEIDGLGITSINQAIRDVVQEAITEAIGNLSETTSNINLPVNDFATLRLDLDVQGVEESNNGLSINLGGRVVPHPDFINDIGVPQPLGPIYTSTALPSADRYSSAHIGATLNVNLLNQALVAAHSVGLTQITMTGGKFYAGYPIDDSDVIDNIRHSPTGFDNYYYDVLSGFSNGDYDPETKRFIRRRVPIYESAYLPDQSPRSPLIGAVGSTRMLVDNQVPAKIEMKQVGGLPQFELSIHEIAIKMQEKLSDASFRTNFGVTINTKVPVSIEVTDQGKLNIAISETMNIDLVNFTLNGKFFDPAEDVVARYLTNTVNEQIQAAVVTLVDSLKGPLEEITIPNFSCMSLDIKNIDAVGGTGNHLGVATDLTVLNDTECNLL
ncbi:MAG: hypothetical protein MI867_08930, partial [Pseudomonadales bacterium]|nr:hypothetical protein [Pseudomonadales bacterium]